MGNCAGIGISGGTRLMARLTPPQARAVVDHHVGDCRDFGLSQRPRQANVPDGRFHDHGWSAFALRVQVHGMSIDFDQLTDRLMGRHIHNRGCRHDHSPHCPELTGDTNHSGAAASGPLNVFRKAMSCVFSVSLKFSGLSSL